LWSSETYDVLAVDHELPDMTGLQICHTVLSDRPDLPVVMITGRGNESIAAEALNIGVRHYLTKDSPTIYENLLPVIITKLANHAQELELKTQAEVALKASEEKYRNLVNVTPFCIHEIDLDGKLLSMNTAGLEMMGVENESQIRGLEYLDIPVPEDRERIAKLMERAIQGEGSTFEFTAKGEFGLVHFSSSFEPVKDNDGRVIRLMGVAQDTTEIKNNESALRQSEETLRSAIESIPEGFAMYDKADRLVLFNQNYFKSRPDAVETMKLGMTYEEQLRIYEKSGQRIKDQSENRIPIEERIKLHKNPQGPMYSKFASGKTYQINEIRTDNGGIASIRTDVTDLLKIQSSLAESESLFQTVVDNSPAALTMKDREGRFLSVNKTFVEWMNASPEEIIGKTINDFYQDDLSEPKNSGEQEILETGKKIMVEGSRLYNDGKHRFISSHKSPIYSADGDISGICTVILDITDRKKSEEALLESEERFRTLFEAANYGILVHRNFKPLYANHALADLYGYDSINEITELESTAILTHPDYDLGGLLHHSEGEPLIADRETMGVRKNGNKFWEDRRSFVINWDGEPAVCSIRSDISTRKLAEESLQKSKEIADDASRAKSTFLAAASHDVRQPLQAMGLFLSVLDDKLAESSVGSDETIQSLVARMNDSVSVLTGMFDTLLDISKLEAQTLTPTITEFSVGIFMQRLFGQFEPQAKEKGLGFNFESTELRTLCDETMLGQILSNFLSNAIRYTDAGEVIFRAHQDGDNIRIEVQDKGIGISKENLAHIFDEFYQVGNQQRDRTKGLGLGLAIAKRTADLLGLKLTVTSEEGRGSTFSIDIPKSE
jgi:PAS domain S-box-containing protein